METLDERPLELLYEAAKGVFDKNGKMSQQFNRDYDKKIKKDLDDKIDSGEKAPSAFMRKKGTASKLTGKSDIIVGRKYLESQKLSNKGFTNDDAKDIGYALRYNTDSISTAKPAVKDKLLANCLKHHTMEDIRDKEAKQETAMTKYADHKTISANDKKSKQLIDTSNILKSNNFKIILPIGVPKINPRLPAPDVVICLNGKYYVVEEKGTDSMQTINPAIKMVSNYKGYGIKCFAVIEASDDKVKKYNQDNHFSGDYKIINTKEYAKMTGGLQVIDASKDSFTLFKAAEEFKPLGNFLEAVNSNYLTIKDKSEKIEKLEGKRILKRKAASINTELFNY